MLVKPVVSKVVRAVITPAPRSDKGSAQTYLIEVEGETFKLRHRAPFCHTARVLLDQGHHPDTILEMRHVDESFVSLRSTIGVAASLTVSEPESGSPKFARYQSYYGSTLDRD